MATTKELTAKENDVREVYKKSVQETASCIFILQHSQTNDQAEIIREAREELEQGREQFGSEAWYIRAELQLFHLAQAFNAYSLAVEKIVEPKGYTEFSQLGETIREYKAL